VWVADKYLKENSLCGKAENSRERGSVFLDEAGEELEKGYG